MNKIKAPSVKAARDIGGEGDQVSARLCRDYSDLVSYENSAYDEVELGDNEVANLNKIFADRPELIELFSHLYAYINPTEVTETEEGKQMKTIDIKKAKMADLISFYNENGKEQGWDKVSKFRDRPTAERRIESLIAMMQTETETQGDAKSPAVAVIEPKPAAKTIKRSTKEVAAKAKAENGEVKEAAKREQVKAAAVKKASSTDDEKATVRSEAVAKTWKDKTVATKRATHHKIEVNGTRYSSLYAAFVSLGLPIVKHISFRKLLKTAGKINFDFNGKSYAFALIPREKPAA